MSLTSTSIWCPCLPRVARQSAGRCPRWDDRSHDGRWHDWREEEARWARGDQPGACGSGDQRRPRGYVVRNLIPLVACTCSWKLVAGLYCRGVSRPGRAALSLWTHCGNEPRRVVWREHLHHVNKPGRHLVFCVIERITLVHTRPLGAWARRTRRGAPSGPSRDASRRTLRSLARCSKHAVSAFE